MSTCPSEFCPKKDLAAHYLSVAVAIGVALLLAQTREPEKGAPRQTERWRVSVELLRAPSLGLATSVNPYRKGETCASSLQSVSRLCCQRVDYNKKSQIHNRLPKTTPTALTTAWRAGALSNSAVSQRWLNTGVSRTETPAKVGVAASRCTCLVCRRPRPDPALLRHRDRPLKRPILGKSGPNGPARRTLASALSEAVIL